LWCNRHTNGARPPVGGKGEDQASEVRGSTGARKICGIQSMTATIDGRATFARAPRARKKAQGAGCRGLGRLLALSLGMILRAPAIGWLWIGLMASSCAAAPPKPAAANRRVKDSPAETISAHRTAAPRSLELEKEEERWSLEAARERRRAREREDAAKPRPGAGAGTTGVVEPNRSP
jgi:hypothetical protein